jgi:putative nucleotidyltransferase with HDIG domain
VSLSGTDKKRSEERKRRSSIMVLTGKNKKAKKGQPPKWVALWRLSSEQKLKVGLCLALVVVLALLLVPYISIPTRAFDVGDVAPHDIKAPADYLVVDEASTLSKHDEAVAKVFPLYDFDVKVIEDLKGKLFRAFSTVQEAYLTRAPDVALPPAVKPEGLLIPKQPPQGTKGHSTDIALVEKTPLFAKKVEEFQKILGIELSKEDLAALSARHFDPALQGAIVQAVSEVMQKGVVANKPLLLEEGSKGIMVREVGKEESRVKSDFSAVIDIKEIDKAVAESARRLPPEVTRSDRRLVTHLAAYLIRPNLTFNKVETENLKSKAIEGVKPVYFQVKKGEMIIREGERVREEHLSKLKGLALYQEKRSRWNAVLGAHLISILLLTLLAGSLYKFSRYTLSSDKELLLIGVVLVGNLLLTKVSIIFAKAFAASLTTVSLASYLYAIPFATGAMLLTILLEKEAALAFAIVLTFFTGLMIQEGLSYPLVCLFSSLVAVLRANEYKRRASILVTGVFIGGINVITIASLDLFSGRLLQVTGLFDCLMGFLGGLVAAVVVSATLPVLEWMFNITSDIKLLELSDLNHPLLRKLVVQAPGTYHHSIIVGNLAEAAAESIGANSLFARVSSYFHDIGKVKKPEYFVENLMGGASKHEKLSPSMSSLIITSHIKDGIELARENKVPEKIIDVIPQHHGTSIMTFFYDKAKKHKDPSMKEVDENDYRYPGPKPQTKEAGIVHLADSVEAAARTLTDPTPARIKGLVRKIVNNKFADGQLDECDLTLKDLNEIVNTFTRTLMGMYHHRVDYPEGEEKAGGVFVLSEEEAGGSRRSESAEKHSDSTEDDSAEGPPPLERVGL